MASNKIRITVFVAVLALACLSGARAGLFGGKSAYEMLADHLGKSTQSNDLADNIKQAANFEVEHNPSASEELKELVGSFQSLWVNTAYPGSLCSRPNMFNLRRVAEAMLAGGNLGPARITPSILRLNSMLFVAIAKIHSICAKQLAMEWHKEWKPSFSDDHVNSHVYELKKVPHSFIEDRYMAQEDERLRLGRALSNAIKSSEESSGQGERPFDTEDRELIGEQLERFVYKPCKEFVKMDVAKSVLPAFNDLRVITFIELFAMDKYYKNSSAKRPYLDTEDDSEMLLDRAVSYRACQKILATPVKELSKLVAKARNFDKKPSRG